MSAQRSRRYCKKNNKVSDMIKKIWIAGCVFFSLNSLSVGQVSAPLIAIDYDPLVVEDPQITIRWDTAEVVDGFVLYYAPMLTLDPIESLDMGLTTSISAPLSALQNTEGYYVAVQSYGPHGASPLSTIRILSTSGLVTQMLDQISRYLQQYNQYQFNQWISLGDMLRFRDRAYTNDFKVNIVDDLNGDVARYYVLPIIGSDGGYIELTKEPNEMSDSSDDPWHEMIHAINDTSATPFQLDNNIDNHSHIEWAVDVIKSALGSNGLAGFEEYASANLGKPTDQLDPPSGIRTIAERARTRWTNFLANMDPANYTAREVTQAHVDELKVLIGFEVDPEKIKQGYLAAGYPREFFEAGPLLTLAADGDLSLVDGTYTASILVPVKQGSASRTFTLVNDGDAPLGLDKQVSSNPAMTISGLSPAALPPGGNRTFTIQVTPAGTAQGSEIRIGQADLPDHDLKMNVYGWFEYSGFYSVLINAQSSDPDCRDVSQILISVTRVPSSPFDYIAQFGPFAMAMQYTGQGRIEGSISGSYPEDGGTTSSNVSLSIDAQGSLSGNSVWSWTAGGGSYSCSGTSSLSGSIN